jgi:hypothetical protein
MLTSCNLYPFGVQKTEDYALRRSADRVIRFWVLNKEKALHLMIKQNFCILISFDQMFLL